MASGVYNRGKYNLSNGVADFGADTILVALVTSSYTPSEAHNVVADLTNELSGGSYARGTLATKTVTENDSTNRIEFKADAQVFALLGAAAGTPKYAILIDDTLANDPLICWIDLGSAPTPDGTDYTIYWNGAAGNQIVFYLG